MIPKDLRDCLASVMLVFWLCVFTIHCKYSISHLLIDVHLYKFFTCLDINKICLKHICNELLPVTQNVCKCAECVQNVCLGICWCERNVIVFFLTQCKQVMVIVYCSLLWALVLLLVNGYLYKTITIYTCFNVVIVKPHINKCWSILFVAVTMSWRYH